MAVGAGYRRGPDYGFEHGPIKPLKRFPNCSNFWASRWVVPPSLGGSAKWITLCGLIRKSGLKLRHPTAMNSFSSSKTCASGFIVLAIRSSASTSGVTQITGCFSKAPKGCSDRGDPVPNAMPCSQLGQFEAETSEFESNLETWNLAPHSGRLQNFRGINPQVLEPRETGLGSTHWRCFGEVHPVWLPLQHESRTATLVQLPS